MRYAIQWVRSLLFIAQMYLAMAVMAIAFLPMALVSLDWTYRAMHSYCRWVRWTAGWMVGLRSEVRGTVPDDEVLVAAKHQSFLDIMIIFHALPRAKFIMKKEILWTPVIGQYTKRMQMIAVDRGKRGKAIQKMMDDVHAGRIEPGQIVIYSQGTRVAPGVSAPYKVGTAVLYGQLGQPCIPVATNAGYFWPRRGLYRRPGLAVVEFLDPIEPGLSKDAFMADLEQKVETTSNALLKEGGWQPNA
jgi:1-acyl-sn-glycerol-3-phosphate acyltransferase